MKLNSYLHPLSVRCILLKNDLLEYPNQNKYFFEKREKNQQYKKMVKHNKGSKLSEVVIHKACYGSSESQDQIGNLSVTS